MSPRELLDQRLDALDRALLGLLPRSERLEFVASLQARLESRPAESSAAAEDVTAAAGEPAVAASNAPRRRGRSGMALTAGVLGIVALVLLFALPLTYLVVATASEALGELVSYTLLSANVLIVALGGSAAVVLGIVALVRLGRQRGRLGHGWAITGLCTGPLPGLVGGLATIVVVLPLLAELADSGNTFTIPSSVCYVPADSVAPATMPVQAVANSSYAAAPASSWSAAAPVAPSSAPNAYDAAPKLSPSTSDSPAATLPDSLPPSSSRDASESSLDAPPPSADSPSAPLADPAPATEPSSESPESLPR